jgi:hypothetical protein
MKRQTTSTSTTSKDKFATITVTVTHDQLAQIDAVRGDVKRGIWLRRAALMRLEREKQK